MAEGRRTAPGPVALVGALAGALAACHGHRDEGPPPLGKALTAAMAAADRAHVPWRCAALDPPALPAEQVGAWTTDDRTLKLGETRPAYTIGVVGDAGGAAPATLAALARLRDKLDGADLVITLGGMGTTKAELEATLGALADKARPLVALPGDLEAEGEQRAAIAALRASGKVVLDGRQARWIAMDGATIATVPGAGAAERLVAGAEGCAWRPGDVARLYSALTARTGVRVAMLAEAPREGTSGELALVPATAVDVVVHGAAALTPARQGGRDGAGARLSPGTADATPRLPQTHAPSAGLLVIRGNGWSWKPLVVER